MISYKIRNVIEAGDTERKDGWDNVGDFKPTKPEPSEKEPKQEQVANS